MRFNSPVIEKMYQKVHLGKAVKITNLAKWLNSNQSSERIVTVVRRDSNGNYTELKSSIKDILLLMKDAGLVTTKQSNGSIKQIAASNYGNAWWILPFETQVAPAENSAMSEETDKT